MALTDETAIENYLLTDIDPSFSAQVSEWIAGVEKEIEQITDRKLIADEVASTEYYDGLNKKRLRINDFLTVTKVELRYGNDDPSPTDITSDVYLYPANKAPKWLMESYFTFPKGLQNVCVTGRRGCFASDAVPTDLKFAATVLVAGIINYSNSSKGEIKSESIGRYTVSYDVAEQKQDFERAKQIIQGYKRVR